MHPCRKLTLGAQRPGLRTPEDLRLSAPTELMRRLSSIRLIRPGSIRVREFSGGRGVDVVLDAVGGPLFEDCLRCLRRGGRQIAMASSGERRVSFDLPDFFHKLLRLSGIDTFKLEGEDIARMMNSLKSGFDNGSLHPPEVTNIPWTGLVKLQHPVHSLTRDPCAFGYRRYSANAPSLYGDVRPPSGPSGDCCRTCFAERPC
jgi:hypothetical protein